MIDWIFSISGFRPPAHWAYGPEGGNRKCGNRFAKIADTLFVTVFWTIDDIRVYMFPKLRYILIRRMAA